MLKKIFGDQHGPEDPFELFPLLEELGLEEHGEAILKACRPCVELELAEFNKELPHTASRLGGHPALPDKFDWPQSGEGEPMVFLGQFTCQELSLAKYPNLPDEGLISVFLDTLEDEPEECQIFYLSLKRDLVRVRPPDSRFEEKLAYRPVFKTGPSLPPIASPEFLALGLDSDLYQDYEEVLDEVEQRRDSTTLQCGGHAPFRSPVGAYPEEGDWEFFLAVHDVEELGINWAEGGCAYLWLPLPDRFQEGQASLTWQTGDEWEEEDEDEE